jgi:hypothetical protein
MRRLLVAAVLVVAAGCGGDDGADAVDGGGDQTSTTLDQSPFCVAVRSLEELGSEPADSEGTPEEVLAQNDEIVALLEAARASTPADAPADVTALFDDYLLLSAAVTTAGGDTTAAFTALQAEQPELVARLSGPDAHRAAFQWFADRCGTAPPA